MDLRAMPDDALGELADALAKALMTNDSDAAAGELFDVVWNELVRRYPPRPCVRVSPRA